jgi:hypothetical protein
MAALGQTAAGAIRISADEFKKRLEARERVTVLDARANKSWDASKVKVAGALRVNPKEFRVDPNWPKDRVTVIY